MEKDLLHEIIDHLLKDEVPSKYIMLQKVRLNDSPLKLISKLEEINQEPKFHPEGNVWNHMLQVVDNAAKLKEYANNPREFMLAAMFHDIGKGSTTKKKPDGRIISYNHDEVGAKLTEEILHYYNMKAVDIDYIVTLVKYHMHHLFIVKDLPYGNIKTMINEANLNDMILLFICDRLGRDQKTYDEKKIELDDISKVIEILKSKYNIELKNIEDNFTNIKNKI